MLTVQVPARLTQKENLILGAFSVLYTINIAVSNISLQLVTVPVRFVCLAFIARKIRCGKRVPG